MSPIGNICHQSRKNHSLPKTAGRRVVEVVESVTQMKTIWKAMILGIATEAIPTSFVIIDNQIGVASTFRAAHDQASFDRLMRAAPHIFYFLAQSTHEPAVYALGYLDMLLEAALGVSGGKPIFEGFGTFTPAWGLICSTQAVIFIAFWAFVFSAIKYIEHRFSHKRHNG